MEAKQALIKKAATLLSSKPTSLLSENSLIENQEEQVVFNLFFTDFNGLLLELLGYLTPFIARDIDKYLAPLEVKPLLRIANLYQYYIDEFVNETPNIFTSGHIHLVGYSGSNEVKDAANTLIGIFKNAQINCINQARRQHKIDLNESESMVDYILLSWEGALYQQRYTDSIKPLFVFNNLLRHLLNL